jgi:hypothetical protein
VGKNNEIIRILSALVFLPVICGFLFSQTGEQVYIAGVDADANAIAVLR